MLTVFSRFVSVELGWERGRGGGVCLGERRSLMLE